MSLWIGGRVLLVVAVLPRREPTELRSVLPTFSRVAFGCVLVIIITGTYQAWRETGTASAITTATYGQLVLVKAALLIGLMFLGNLSRLAIQRRYVSAPIPVTAGAGSGNDHGEPAKVALDTPPDAAVRTRRAGAGGTGALGHRVSRLTTTRTQRRGRVALGLGQHRA